MNGLEGAPFPLLSGMVAGRVKGPNPSPALWIILNCGITIASLFTTVNSLLTSGEQTYLPAELACLRHRRYSCRRQATATEYLLAQTVLGRYFCSPLAFWVERGRLDAKECGGISVCVFLVWLRCLWSCLWLIMA